MDYSKSYEEYKRLTEMPTKYEIFHIFHIQNYEISAAEIK